MEKMGWNFAEGKCWEFLIGPVWGSITFMAVGREGGIRGK
jgi:hypothetical protein